jgi:hypothetical protein
VQVKSPYSYVVEVDGVQRHLHANKMRKFHEHIESAIVNNYAVVYEPDNDFGVVETVETHPLLSQNSQVGKSTQQN